MTGYATCSTPLQWSHNERDGVSNHWRIDCLLKRLFRCRSKKKSKLRVLASVGGIHQWPVKSLHKELLTRKMFPFDDVIMPSEDRFHGEFRGQNMFTFLTECTNVALMLFLHDGNVWDCRRRALLCWNWIFACLAVNNLHTGNAKIKAVSFT